MPSYFKAYQKCFDFRGRASRKDFWYFYLVHLIIIQVLLLYGLSQSDFNLIPQETLNAMPEKKLLQLLLQKAGVMFQLYLFVSFLPSISVSIRRLHDSNKSAILVLLQLFVPIGTFLFLAFACLPGTKGENDFGPDPYDQGGEDPQRIKTKQNNGRWDQQENFNSFEDADDATDKNDRENKEGDENAKSADEITPTFDQGRTNTERSKGTFEA